MIARLRAKYSWVRFSRSAADIVGIGGYTLDPEGAETECVLGDALAPEEADCAAVRCWRRASTDAKGMPLRKRAMSWLSPLIV